jgi:NADPH:quinone reductase
MKAVVVRQFGPPEVMNVEEMPDPSPAVRQIAVRIAAAGVNPVDTYIRSGAYARKPDLPYVPGADAAGVIERTGDAVTGFKSGDRVYISGSAPGFGSYAEATLCDVSQVYRLPDRITFEQGAGVFTPYATAYRALFQRAHGRAGEWVLVHGASGGVGTAAVQLARAAGLRVIGTAGTRDGLDLVMRQGAHHALNHRDSGYLDQVARLTGGKGPDVILEMLANVNLERDLAVLAFGGRIAVIGNRGTIEIDPRKAMAKDAAILGVAIWNTPPEDMLSIHAALGAGLDNGTLTPVVGRTMALADAPKAHVAVLESGAHGKIVLVP